VSVSQTPSDASGAPDDRRIQVAGLGNLRDVGGYPAGEGRTTRWRRLLRSDAPHVTDAAGRAVLAGYELRTVLDLRTGAEAVLAPVALDGIAARRLRISLLGPDLHRVPRQLDAIYRYLIEERGDTIAAAVSALAGAGRIPALVHCSAGKDRTGVVIGLVLAVLGVPDEVIAIDYALSAHRLSPAATSAIAQLQASSGLGGAFTPELASSPPQLLLDVLAWARAAGGTVDGYLVSHGVSRAELDELHEQLTE
jgi:protein-tyrosine phosphatase